MPKKSIETFIHINAPVEKVWKTLAYFNAYPQWNPFITSIEGSPVAGEGLRVTLEPPGGRKMTFAPKITALEKNRVLVWKGRLFIPGLFDGEHRFIMESLAPRRVLFRQEEAFSGILVPFFSLDATIKGFEAMNAALKAKAEAS